MGKSLTTEEFIEKAKNIHGDKYDYSLVEYINKRTKVKIICKEHGIFEQKPIGHLSGNGCLECSGKKKHTTQSFIEKANRIHNNTYDYSLVEYVNSSTKLKLYVKNMVYLNKGPKHILRVMVVLHADKKMV